MSAHVATVYQCKYCRIPINGPSDPSPKSGVTPHRADCPRARCASVCSGLQPSDEVSVHLHQHEHQWQHVGAKSWPSGHWHPVFTCAVCGDQICDLKVEVDVLGQPVLPPGAPSSTAGAS